MFYKDVASTNGYAQRNANFFRQRIKFTAPAGLCWLLLQTPAEGRPLIYIVSHFEPDVVLTRQLTLSLRRQQDLLEGVPLIRRQQSGVDHCHLSLQLDSTAIWP